MKTFLAGVLPNSLYLVCMPQKLKWTQRVWAANSQPPLSCAATGHRHTECWAGRPATTYTCARTRQFWRVSFFKALMAWPQHLLHFLKTDRLWSSTCSSHTAALSRNDRTHTHRGWPAAKAGAAAASGLNFPSAVRAVPAMSWLSGHHGTVPTTQQCRGCQQFTDVLLNRRNQPEGRSGLVARCRCRGSWDPDSSLSSAATPLGNLCLPVPSLLQRDAH